MQDKFSPKPKPASYCNIITGKYNLNSEDEENYSVSAISELIMHPNWKPNRQNYDADLAVVILDAPIEFTFNIRPVCLPKSEGTFENIIDKKGILAGYNEKYDNEQEITTRHLKLNEISVINEDKCLEQSPIYDSILTHRTFCSSAVTNGDNVKGESRSN